MKKLKPKLFVRLPSVCLVREDLQHIENLLKEHCSLLRVSDGENEFENIDDFALHHTGSVSRLEISATEQQKGFSSVTLVFMRGLYDGSYLYASSDDVAEGVYYKLKEYLSSRRRRLIQVFDLPGTLAPAILYYCVMMWILISRAVNLWELFGLCLGCAVITVGGFTLGMKVRTGGLFYITMKPMSEKLSFWERNKDKIVVGMICGAFGAVFGSIVMWIASKLK